MRPQYHTTSTVPTPMPRWSCSILTNGSLKTIDTTRWMARLCPSHCSTLPQAASLREGHRATLPKRFNLSKN